MDSFPALQAGTSARFAVYLTMRDGVRIAVDVWLPDAALQGRRVPTLCWFTRYWRAMLQSPGAPPRVEQGDLIRARGFAFIHVDARGSGASFGSRPVEYPHDEVLDMREVIAWVASQSWSNGRVATDGISYVGNTAELAAVYRHPALRAAVPRYTDFDYYDQILFPGGLQNLTFVHSWGKFVKALDRNDVDTLRDELQMEFYRYCEGVKPVDGRNGVELLHEAVRDHETNSYYVDLCKNWLFRDDIRGADRGKDAVDRLALYAYRDALERAAVPMQHWIGWLDSATAAGALARFATFDAPNEILIGPWNHGGLSLADTLAPPGAKVSPTVEEQRAKILDFVSRYVLRDDAPQLEKSVYYYTMGAGTWTRTNVWPPAGSRVVTYFCHADGSLRLDRPRSMGQSRIYAIDFGVGSGQSNRWATSMGGTAVIYPDRAEIDRRLLTYTSAPLTAPVTITGHPQVTLFVESTHSDGAFIVYLETVKPDGRVIYLTEGILRAIHRRVSDAKPPYEMFGPYRSFLRKDAWPLEPGVRAELTFNLIPTSVRLEAGWCVRIAIAGHDCDTFLRVPESGSPVLRLFSSEDAPSCIRLPEVPAT